MQIILQAYCIRCVGYLYYTQWLWTEIHHSPLWLLWDTTGGNQAYSTLQVTKLLFANDYKYISWSGRKDFPDDI
jgi:hypothetical protein